MSALAGIVDLVLAITLVEALALLAWHAATGRGLAWREWGANLVAGLCLMLALRNAVHGAAPAWVLLCLVGAGVAHGSDIAQRLRRRRSGAFGT